MVINYGRCEFKDSLGIQNMKNLKKKIVIITVLLFLLFGCVQSPDPEIPKGKSYTSAPVVSPEVSEKPQTDPITNLTDMKNESEERDAPPEIPQQEEIENETQFGADNGTQQLVQFDPKSFGNPNPRNIQSHPEECCNHPYYHYVVSASSSDGLNWQEDNVMIRDHSSVPDFAILEDGTNMLYFVDGVYDTLGCMESKDGETFADYDCRIYNFTKEKIWDPNVVSIGNGTYRMFFFSPESDPSIEQPNDFDQPKNRIFSAISSNGKDWLMESGVRYEDVSITDPSVIRVSTNKWYMFVSRGTSVVQAESNDGLNFKKLQEITSLGGVPDVVNINGEYFLFTCSNGISYSTSNNLISWSGLKNAIKAWSGGVICDPTVEKTNDGYKMYLKRMGFNKK